MSAQTPSSPGPQRSTSVLAGPRHTLLTSLAALALLLSSGIVAVGVAPAVAATVTPLALAPPDDYYIGHNVVLALDGDLVVGRVEDVTGGEQRAVAWDLSTDPPTTTLLPSLGSCVGLVDEWATGVSGTYVVGYSLTSDCYWHAVAWDMTESPPTILDLGALTNGPLSMATGISGTTVVGWADTSGNHRHAAMWNLGTDPPTFTDLGTLTTGLADGGHSEAIAVDGDVVAGNSRGSDGLDHGVAWDLRTSPPTMSDLGLMDSKSTYAYNVGGTVVVGGSDYGTFYQTFAYDLASPGQVRLAPVRGDSTANRFALAVDGPFAVGFSGAHLYLGPGVGFDWFDHAAAWDLRTSPPDPIDLGTLVGDLGDSAASDVDGYLAVGRSQSASSPMHAVVWNLTVSPPEIIDLGSLGGMSQATHVQGNRAAGTADVSVPGSGTFRRAVAWDLPNFAPVAFGEEYGTVQNQTLSTSAVDGVLPNDLDANNDPLTASVVRDVAHGTLTLDSDGSFVLTPTAGYVGSDWFTYAANDGTVDSNAATVALAVAPPDLAASVGRGPIVKWPARAPVPGYNEFRFDDHVSSPKTGATLWWENAAGKVHLSAQVIGGTSHYIAFAEGVTDVCTLEATAYTYVYLATIAPDDPTNGFVLIRTNTSPPYYIAVHVDEVRESSGVATDLDAIWYFQTTGSGTFCSTNSAPVAIDDTYSIGEDATLTVPVGTGVLANDSDVDGDALTATVDTDASHGTLTLASDGSFDYTPDADFNGTDVFTYVAGDGTVTSDAATVTVTVTPVNDPPVASDDTYSIGEDATLTVLAASGVLANDSDVDGDALTATVDSDVSHGALTLNSDGSFTYTPDANFNGTDTFTYLADDGTVTSDAATVTVTVTPVNDPPVAVDDDVTVAEDGSITIYPLANDYDVDSDLAPNRLWTQTLPLHGTAVANIGGYIVYRPAADYNGTDRFEYQMCEAGPTPFQCRRAWVNITVTPVNDPPVANDDTATANEDTPTQIDALVNDTDVDGDALTVTEVTDPTHGTATLGGTQYTVSIAIVISDVVTYTPDADYCGSDTFGYTVSDGNGGTDTATVTVTVHCVNDPPVANDDTYSIGEDATLTVLAASGVLANDTDVDGDALTATVDTDVSHGTLTLNGDGSFDYTPDADFNGTDTFTYVAGDGTVTSDAATVTVTVTPVNDPPAAPDGLAQLDVNSVPIAIGGSTTDTAVTFTATLADPVEGDQVRLEVEVNPVGTIFDGTGLVAGVLTASGTDGTVTVSPLAFGTYHWRARTVDEHGAASGWVTFGGNTEAETDFEVHATTTVLYTGEQLVRVGRGFEAAAVLSSSAAVCIDTQTVEFSVPDDNPATVDVDDGPLPIGAATTDSFGRAVLSGVDTADWQPGVYTIRVQFHATDGCGGSVDEATMTIAPNGDAASGGGFYTLPGIGRVNFGFTVSMVPGTEDEPEYRGQLLLINNGKWRLKGTLDDYVSLEGHGAASGTGWLYWWDVTLNDGAGGWVRSATDVPFTISFDDIGHGRNAADAFGIHIGYAVGDEPHALPNSEPELIKGGNISIKDTGTASTGGDIPPPDDDPGGGSNSKGNGYGKGGSKK